MELLVAASALATDSVDGHRSRPSAAMRLDLLNVVGSRPERLASPEGDIPARSASRSSAVQTWLWVRGRDVLACLAIGRLTVGFRNYCLNRPVCANPPVVRPARAVLELSIWRR